MIDSFPERVAKRQQIQLSSVGGRGKRLTLATYGRSGASIEFQYLPTRGLLLRQNMYQVQQ